MKQNTVRINILSKYSILINSFTFLLDLLNLVLILAKFETLKGNDTIIFFGSQKC